MKKNFKLRTGLWLLLGTTLVMGSLSIGFVGFGISHLQGINQQERSTRLLASSVNEALLDFKNSRSFSQRLLIVSNNMHHFHEAALKFLPEFKVAVEDSKTQLVKASELARKQGFDSKTLSFLPTRLDAYERSFIGLVSLTKKFEILRKDAQLRFEQILNRLEPIAKRWNQQRLIALLLEAHQLEPVGG